MPHHMAYCSACDRPVPVDYQSVARLDTRHRAGGRPEPRHVPDDPSQLVCLEYPTRCTGAMCPMFSIAGDPAGDAEAARDMRAVEPRQ